MLHFDYFFCVIIIFKTIGSYSKIFKNIAEFHKPFKNLINACNIFKNFNLFSTLLKRKKRGTEKERKYREKET